MCYRETTLNALRGILGQAGDKCTEPLRKQIHIAMISLLNHPEDVTRILAGGCFGAICKFLPQDQLDTVLTDQLLSKF